MSKKTGKRKSKRTKKQPKCTLCNPYRWMGNTKERHRHSYYRQQKLPVQQQQQDNNETENN